MNHRSGEVAKPDQKRENDAKSQGLSLLAFDFRQDFHASGPDLPLKFKLRSLDILSDFFCHFIPLNKINKIRIKYNKI